MSRFHWAPTGPFTLRLLTFTLILIMTMSSAVLAQTPIVDDPPIAPAESAPVDEVVPATEPVPTDVPTAVPTDVIVPETDAAVDPPQLAPPLPTAVDPPPDPERTPVAKPLATLQISLRDSSGAERVLPTGQRLCLSITLTPSPTGAYPMMHTCYTTINGIPRLWANMPDSAITTYQIAVGENSTGCTVAIDRQVTINLGAGRTHVVFHALSTCPDVPLDPTSFAGYSIAVQDDTGATRGYSNRICARLRVTPTTSFPARIPACAVATGIMIEESTAADELLITSSFDATITVNDTGCAVTQTTSAETIGGEAFVRIVLTMACPTSVPTPTEVPSEAYDAIYLEYADSTGTGRTWPGQLCADAEVDPPTAFAGFGSTCYAGTGVISGQFPPVGSLPLSATYTGIVISNATGCEVTSSTRTETVEGESRIVVIMTTWCDGEVPSPTAPPTAPPPTTVPTEPGPIATVPVIVRPTVVVIPSPTATATTTPTIVPTEPSATTVPTEPASTVTVTPTATIASTVTPTRTPSASDGTVTPTAPAARRNAVPSATRPVVASLPVTGSGPTAVPIELIALTIVGVFSIASVTVLAVRRDRTT